MASHRDQHGRDLCRSLLGIDLHIHLVVIPAPGMVHNIAFSTMFVCSVNTVLLNANPLMRF